MADGLHAGGVVGNDIEKTLVNIIMDYKTNNRINESNNEKVTAFYSSGRSGKLCKNFSDKNNENTTGEGLLAPSTEEDDYRKKRCVDRYDSSESSDSGVATLSCTDCSGSSTASSDITDPGSPFSTTSNHSEDSGGPHPSKMPPALSHHPPWPHLWTHTSTEDVVSSGGGRDRSGSGGGGGRLSSTRSSSSLSLVTVKQPLSDKTALMKRLKTAEEAPKKQVPLCLLEKSCSTASSTTNNINNKIVQNVKKVLSIESSPNNISYNNNNNYYKSNIKEEIVSKQEKITKYYKTQAKPTGVRKYLLKCKNSDLTVGTTIYNQQTAFNNNIKSQILMPSNNNNNSNRKDNRVLSMVEKQQVKSRNFSTSTPRKILPAPSKIPETIPANNFLHSFTPTVTLTAVSFPPNVAYLHAKVPKPSDGSANSSNVLQMSPFATITNNNGNALPLINGIKIAHPTTINDMNCVKLVVPTTMVNLNTLPSSRLNSNNNIATTTTASVATAVTNNIGNFPLKMDTALPTVLTARPKLLNHTLPKQYCNNIKIDGIVSSTVTMKQCRNGENVVSTSVEPCRTDKQQQQQQQNVKEIKEPPDDEKLWDEGSQSRHTMITEQKSPSPIDSDSGFSSRCSLEISVDETISASTIKAKISPILSQPKTIRFPPIKQQKEKPERRNLGKSSTSSSLSASSTTTSTNGCCRWDECASYFETSGVLLEHLQLKHVISQSQANEEQYVCLWRGCKVYGRRSCSISWLERHVLAHAGTKPFRCIVDGCGQRFNSQLMLERHVNNHFNTDGSQNTSAKKSVESHGGGGPVKHLKRNGRIIKFRRQPWSGILLDFSLARMFDFLDSGMMEGLQHKLLQMSNPQLLGPICNGGVTVHFHSQILAKRTDLKGSKELLVRWHPENIIEDEWILEKDFNQTKVTPFASLSLRSRQLVNSILFNTNDDRRTTSHQKIRRKQQSARKTNRIT